MLTQAHLKTLVHYREDGTLIWIVPGTKYTGRKVGAIQPGKKERDKIYLRTKIDKKSYLVHRLVWLYHTGEFPKGRLDHRDGDGLNNRFSNLRESTPSQNAFNSGRPENNTAGEKNVYWYARNNKWGVLFSIKGTRKFYGLFDLWDDAVAFARKKREELHGEFCRHE